MRAYMHDARVQERACLALGTLANNTANHKAIAQAGGIEEIVTAMVAHQAAGMLSKWVSWVMGNILAQVGVQQKACFALGMLANDNGAHQAQIARAGGIEQVLAAMAAHQMAVELQQEACWALRNLAADDNVAAKIAESGGIERVVAAMVANPSAVEVQKCACGMLVILSQKKRSVWCMLFDVFLSGTFSAGERVVHVRRIKTAGGVECVLQAIVATDAAEDTKKWGRQLLNDLDSRRTWESKLLTLFAWFSFVIFGHILMFVRDKIVNHTGSKYFL